jgi:hypothetical protein
MTEIHDQLAAAADEVARLARTVTPAQHDAPTPCSEFDVTSLCVHLMQEIVLHGWDLAVATGQTPRFSDEVAATVLRWLEAEDERFAMTTGTTRRSRLRAHRSWIVRWPDPDGTRTWHRAVSHWRQRACSAADSDGAISVDVSSQAGRTGAGCPLRP